MKHPPDNKDNPPGKEPSRSKHSTRAKGATDPEGQNSMGKNVIGPVKATGHAQVKLSQKIEYYTQLSEDEEERQKEESELRQLENAIQQKYADLTRLVDAPLPEGGNPFLFTQPFDFSDNRRFFGRSEGVQEILAYLKTNHTTFLDGYGKTSALHAGVVPALVRAGHLPLLVSVSTEPLETTIKKQILPNIEAKEFLRKMPLAEFIRRISDKLEQGKNLYILVDNFETLYAQPDTARQAFKLEWELCASEIACDIHWLFAVPSGSTNLLKIFKEKAPVNLNLVTLQPLGLEEAREVILRTAALGNIKLDPAVTESILSILGRPDIDPAQLQVVCHMLARGPGRAVICDWTMAYYQSQGRADGILSSYLERTINEFGQEERDPAWQLLAALVEQSDKALSEDELLEKARELNIEESIARQTLKDLCESHLVDSANAYRLSSESLRPRVKEWLEARSLRQKAQREIVQQIRGIRASALRGLLGGAVGFGLAYFCLPYPERDLSQLGFYFYNLTIRSLLGGVAGFLLILSVDFIITAYQGRQRRLRFPMSALAGGLAFALLITLHVYFRYFGTDIWIALSKAAAVGALWGAACGLGVMWCISPHRFGWGAVPIASLVCGTVLFLSEWLIKGLDLPSTAAAGIFVAGVVMPLCLIGFTLLGKRPSSIGGET